METLVGKENMVESNEGSARRICVAIDGPAGAGKSTVAKKVAEKLGYLYIDTGAMYRAATWVALEQKADPENKEQVVNLVSKAKIELLPPDQSSQGRVRVFVNGADVSFIIRSRIISRFVSAISAIAPLRELLVAKQQEMARSGGVVMDGRDIGTVVLPSAELKLFLTASAQVRAERRLKDMKEMGQTADLDTIIQDINERDHLDSTREASPLKQADDAILIDTDAYTQDEVCNKVLSLCYEKIESVSGESCKN